MPINFLQAFRMAFGEREMALVEPILDNVYRSPRFVRSDRLTALLRYLIAEELGGRGRKISPYSIAIDVYGRSEDFDPTIDSLVRVEMHRLRTALEQWDQDSANTDPYRLEFPRGKYRPTLRRRTPSDDLDARPRPTDGPQGMGRRTAAVLFPALVLSIAIFSIYMGVRPTAPHCASLRPTLALPARVDGLPTREGELFLDTLKADMAAYTLMDIFSGRSPPCVGAPEFALTLQHLRDQHSDESMAVTVRSRTSGNVIKFFVVRWRAQGMMSARAVTSAKISFLIGFFQGIVPLAAMRERWSDPSSEREFRCMMMAREFIASRARDKYSPARACLLEHFRSSQRADVSGALATIELAPRWGNSPLPHEDQQNYFDEAMRAGEAIDPMDNMLLLAKLRRAATYPTNDNNEVRHLLDALAMLYPNQPISLHQMAAVRVRNFGEDDLADRLSQRASDIAGSDAALRWPQIFRNLKTGDWNDRELIAGLRDDPFYISQIAMIDAARHIGDPAMIERARSTIRKGDCGSKACLRDRISKEGFDPPLERRLLALVEANL